MQQLNVSVVCLKAFLAEKAVLFSYINNTNSSFSYHSLVHQPSICLIHLNNACPQPVHHHSGRARTWIHSCSAQHLLNKISPGTPFSLSVSNTAFERSDTNLAGG